jgi:lysophospholipase L1-like esterase
MKLAKGTKWVMIGDSITDAGRAQPGAAEGLFDPLGRGYVTMTNALVQARYPERNIRIINVGTSGNTVRELKGRWQKDVLDLKPTWLSVMIGINDVWRQFDIPNMTEQHVLPDEYERIYDELLKQTRPTLEGLILMSPYFVESNKTDPMRVRMAEYAAIVGKLAEKYDAVFVDMQKGIDEVLAHQHPMALAWDRVHVNQPGHMVLTRTLLKALDYQW